MSDELIELFVDQRQLSRDLVSSIRPARLPLLEVVQLGNGSFVNLPLGERLNGLQSSQRIGEAGRHGAGGCSRMKSVEEGLTTQMSPGEATRAGRIVSAIDQLQANDANNIGHRERIA